MREPDCETALRITCNLGLCGCCFDSPARRHTLRSTFVWQLRWRSNWVWPWRVCRVFVLGGIFCLFKIFCPLGLLFPSANLQSLTSICVNNEQGQVRLQRAHFSGKDNTIHTPQSRLTSLHHSPTHPLNCLRPRQERVLGSHRAGLHSVGLCALVDQAMQLDQMVF